MGSFRFQLCISLWNRGILCFERNSNFEEVKNKETMRKEHLYLAGLGTIGLTLLFVGAIFVV